MTAAPIILLNAFPLDRSQWEPLIAALEATGDPAIGDMIAFDYPGLGDMPATEEEPSLELIADAAVDAMREATGAPAAVWVSCSMGGYVAMAIAERHPEAVAGLVLTGTKATADTDEARAKRLELADSVADAPGLPDPAAAAEPLVGTPGDARAEVVATVAANVARQPGAGVAWGQRAMAARPDRLEVLRGLEVPAAVMAGELDGIAPPREAELMAAALGVEAEVVPGVGHLLAIEATERVAAAVLRVATAASAAARG